MTVVGLGNKRRLAAFATLAGLVQHQVALAQQAGVVAVPLGWRCVPIMPCVVRCPLCRNLAARVVLFVGVWPGEPSASPLLGQMVGNGWRG